MCPAPVAGPNGALVGTHQPGQVAQGAGVDQMLGFGEGAELDALDAPAEVPVREQVEQALAALGHQVEDVLSEDRSPELLHEFYASTGLSLTWDQSARRLTAKLDLAPAVADLIGRAEPLIRRG